jgi:hypothetical protein
MYQEKSVNPGKKSHSSIQSGIEGSVTKLGLITIFNPSEYLCTVVGMYLRVIPYNI